MYSYAEAQAIVHILPVGAGALERYEDAEKRRDFRQALRKSSARGPGPRRPQERGTMTERLRQGDERLWLRRYDEILERGAFHAEGRSGAELRVGLALAAFLGLPVYASEAGLEPRERGQAAIQSPQSVPSSRHLAKQALARP